MSTDAPPSQISGSPSNSGQESACIKPEAQDDADSPTVEPLSPVTQVSASNSSPKRKVPTLQTAVNQHSLAGFARSSEYSDLELAWGGPKVLCSQDHHVLGIARPQSNVQQPGRSPQVTCHIHSIPTCSHVDNLCQEPGQPLRLDQYDLETLKRLMSFCYRRTYNDGEFPFTVAPFLTGMTANDVRESLEAPLLVLSDVEDPEWVAESTERDGSKDTKQEQDEYLPSSCDIHCALEYASYPLKDDVLSVDVPSEPQQPPYEISLFANFNLYIAAKELQIPALQLVARERFVHSLRAHWARFADLPALIEQVFSRTDGSDPLRGLICQIVGAVYDSEFDMAFKAEIRELMTKNGEFAAELLDATLRLRSGWTDAWG